MKQEHRTFELTGDGRDSLSFKLAVDTVSDLVFNLQEFIRIWKEAGDKEMFINLAGNSISYSQHLFLSLFYKLQVHYKPA